MADENISQNIEDSSIQESSIQVNNDNEKETQTNLNNQTKNLLQYYGYSGKFKLPENITDFSKFPDIFNSDNSISDDICLFFYSNTFLINLINLPKVTVFGFFTKRREDEDIYQTVDLGYLVKIDSVPDFLFLSPLLQNYSIMNLSKYAYQNSHLNSLANIIICNYYRLIGINPDILMSYLIKERENLKIKHNEEIDNINSIIYDMKNIKKEYFSNFNFSIANSNIANSNIASSSIASSSNSNRVFGNIDIPKGIATDGKLQVKINNRAIEIHKYKMKSTNSFLKYYAKYIEYYNNKKNSEIRNQTVNTLIDLDQSNLKSAFSKK